MKKLFEETKRDLKFKLAGPGHKLSNSSSGEPNSRGEPSSRGELSKTNENPSTASLNAALLRCSKNLTDSAVNSPLRSKKKTEDRATSSKQVENDGRPEGDTANLSNPDSDKPETNVCDNIARNPILFTCDQFADILLTKTGWKEKFRTHISDIKSSDPILASILAIKSLNNDQEAEHSIKVIEKYVNNLISYPDIDKYKLIRLKNPIAQKLLQMEGTKDFLFAIGFNNHSVFDEKEQKEEAYLMYHSKDGVDLSSVIISLASIQGFSLKLNRNIKMFLPGDGSSYEEYDDEFFQWTVKDIRKEHQSRMSQLEKNQQLRTRKMRVIDAKVKPKVNAEYAMIRVRFHDGLFIQGAFETNEKLSDIRALINEKIKILGEFNFLYLPNNKIYDTHDEEKSLLQLDLYPAVMLMVKWSDPCKVPNYILRENA